MKRPSYPWNFRRRARALGWRGSSLAIQRLKEALAEIKSVYRSAPALAADDWVSVVRLSWSPEHRGYFRGTTRCLSCLLAAGRYQELLDLIETAPFLYWNYRRYGVRALAAQDRTDEAISYAEASVGLNDNHAVMARACAAILLAAGRPDEAYHRYALTANQAGTHLATFRAIKKKYPDKTPRDLLDDLIASTPDDSGRWFATAKGLGFLDLAADLTRRSPVDIGTLRSRAPWERGRQDQSAALNRRAKNRVRPGVCLAPGEDRAVRRVTARSGPRACLYQ